MNTNAVSVLVVEDDEILRVFYGKFLAKLGFHYLIAASAAEGVEALQDPGNLIDIVFTDMNVPEFESGREVIAAAKARGITQIILTSGTFAEEEVAELQITAFILKGCRTEEIIAALRASEAAIRQLQPC